MKLKDYTDPHYRPLMAWIGAAIASAIGIAVLIMVLL